MTQRRLRLSQGVGILVEKSAVYLYLQYELVSAMVPVDAANLRGERGHPGRVRATFAKKVELPSTLSNWIGIPAS